jgi:hypothetical protein
MNRPRTWIVAAALAFAPLAVAQTLVEVTTVTAIVAQLQGATVQLPSGSLRAMGTGTGPVIARVPDAASWTDFEIYTAQGIAAALEPALVYGVERDLFMVGFERAETTPSQLGATAVTRVVFAHADGRRALLTTFRTGREFVWLLARSR